MRSQLCHVMDCLTIIFDFLLVAMDISNQIILRLGHYSKQTSLQMCYWAAECLMCIEALVTNK